MITEQDLLSIGFKWKTRLGDRVLLLPLGRAAVSGGDQWIERSNIVDNLFELHRAIDDEVERGIESWVEFEPHSLDDLKTIVNCFSFKVSDG